MKGPVATCILTAAALGCSRSPAPETADVGVSDADADTDADGDADSDSDADADMDADTDTASQGSTSDSSYSAPTADTSTPSCTPEHLIVHTPGTVANPGAGGVLRFSACVDPDEGTLHAVRQMWFGDIDATVLCMYTWEVETSEVVTDCTDCDWAFQFNWGTPYEDGTTMCEEGWWAPGELYTPIDVRLGFRATGGQSNGPDVLWDTDADGIWVADYDVYHGLPWPSGSEIDASFDGEQWSLTYKYGAY